MNAYTDGACRVSNPGLCASAFAVYRHGELFHKSVRVLPVKSTNNVAEYQALLDLLAWAGLREISALNICCDSQLVVNQVNGFWMAREHLDEMCSTAQKWMKEGGHQLQWVRGHDTSEGNIFVDRLCNELLDKYQEEERNRAITEPSLLRAD